MRRYRHHLYQGTATLLLVLSFSLPAGSTEIGPIVQNDLEGTSIGIHYRGAEANLSWFPPLIELTVVEDSLSISQNPYGMSVLGEVRNDNEVTASTPIVSIAVIDESGRLVGTKTVSAMGAQPDTHFLSDWWNILPAGEVGWFSCYLPVPEGIEIREILIDAHSIETDVAVATVPLEMVGDWRIGDYGQLTATIRNTSPLDLVGVSTSLAIRSADGKILGITVATSRGEKIGGYAEGLRGGEEAEFTAFLSYDPDVLDTAEIETRLKGRVYEGSQIDYGIVGVAHRTGMNGSFWRSSLSITNRSGATGNVSLSFRQGESRIDVDVEIPNETSDYWTDVTQTLFGIDGSAAGYIQIASDVPLSITARTFNSTSAGDFGQALPVFTPTDTRSLRWDHVGVLSLVRGTQLFRTNLGLVNMSDESCSARIRLHAPDGSQIVDLGNIQLEPTSWRQLNDVVPGGNDVAYATVENSEGCSIWAYASVIENSSGDPTTIEVAPEVKMHVPGSVGSPSGASTVGGWAE